MNARYLVFAGILLAGLAVGIAWLLGSGSALAVDAPPLPRASDAAPAEPATATLPAIAETPEEHGAPTTTRTEVPAPAPTAPTRPDATLRGRCVDADGSPLAGCVVTMHGWGANSERTDAWLRDHPTPPDWTDPTNQATGDDGTFSFTFWPPPPFQFSLRLGKDARSAMQGRWSKIDEGSIVDVGDVVMQLGVRLTGRVVNETGKPQTGIEVRAQAKQSERSARFGMGRVGAETTNSARTDDAGRFELRYWLAPGGYALYTLKDYKPTDHGEVELSAERPLEDVTLVLKTPAEVPTIAGRIVDEIGQPVREARIESRSAPHGRFSSASSRRDGTFVLERGEQDTPKEVMLAVECDGYEGATTPSPVPWGATDVELRLQRGGVLTVCVTDEATRPVENYTVRVMPRESNRFSSEDSRVRARGPFENGTTTIPGITLGKWTVIVEFPSATSLLMVMEKLEIAARGPARVDVRAETGKTRTLRVVRASGEPVVGTQVQLCEQLAGTFSNETRALSLGQFFNLQGPNTAVLVCEGTTAADGTMLLSGPGSQPLGLRVLGPGHVPTSETNVFLTSADELVVTVSGGARLKGTVGPPEALAELRRLAGLGPSEAFTENSRPSIQLQQGTGRGTIRLPRTHKDPFFRLAADGSFDVAGLPAGSWQVSVAYHRRIDANSSTSNSQHAAEVALVDGQATELEIDLQTMLPGTLEGSVSLNGAPVRNAQVSLQSEHGLLPSGGADQSWDNVKTDADGRFTHRGRPGTYAALLWKQGAQPLGNQLVAQATALVLRGETTRHTFAIWSGTIEVTLLDAAGKPVPDVAILLSNSAGHSTYLPKTAADGSCQAEVTAESATMKVLPKRLQTPEAQQKLWLEARAGGSQDPLAPHWITLGTTTIQGSQTNKLTLRLPAEWDQ